MRHRQSSIALLTCESVEVDSKEKKPRQPVPVEGLEFVGKVQASEPLKLGLFYAEEVRRGRLIEKEASLTLDLRKAKEVAIPAEAKARKTGPTPKEGPGNSVRDDL